MEEEFWGTACGRFRLFYFSAFPAGGLGGGWEQRAVREDAGSDGFVSKDCAAGWLCLGVPPAPRNAGFKRPVMLLSPGTAAVPPHVAAGLGGGIHLGTCPELVAFPFLHHRSRRLEEPKKPRRLGAGAGGGNPATWFPSRRSSRRAVPPSLGRFSWSRGRGRASVTR